MFESLKFKKYPTLVQGGTVDWYLQKMQEVRRHNHEVIDRWLFIMGGVLFTAGILAVLK